MATKARAGLLPLYLKLYDDAGPETRRPLEEFLDRVAAGLRAEGLEVIKAPVCRVKAEFQAAVARLEKENADALVTLHLAYSPSLEAVETLAATSLPLIMLDTTPDYDFGPDTDPQRIMFNHGIHGVQDLASVLRARGRSFEIAAGHFEHSAVLRRTVELVRAARGARRLRRARVARLGESFAGMGDFAVPDEVLRRRLGISVIQAESAALGPFVEQVTAKEIEAELERDRRAFQVVADAEVHRRSVRVGLGLRKYLEAERADACTVNFAAFNSPDEPVSTVPFPEISKAMARGIGYAGEGDALTAALTAGLLAAFERATFTEIFCPDWKGDTLFLSHMGELNPATAAEKPLLCEKDFPFTAARNPAILACAVAPGPAVFVNLAPGPKESFRLLITPVEVLEDMRRPEMKKVVRGRIRPRCGIAEFLEVFSRCGGTHHSALVLGDRVEATAAFARFAGLEYRLIP